MVKISFKPPLGSRIVRTTNGKDFLAHIKNIEKDRTNIYTEPDLKIVKIEKNYVLEHRETFQFFSYEIENCTCKEIFIIDKRNKHDKFTISLGDSIICRSWIYNFYSSLIYSDFIKPNFGSENRSLIKAVKILKFVKFGAIVETERKTQMFFHEKYYHFPTISIKNRYEINYHDERIREITNINPGDEVSLIGTECNFVVRSVMINIENLFTKKVCVQGSDMFIFADNYVLVTNETVEIKNKVVKIKSGHPYVKVFWSKNGKYLIGFYMDSSKKFLIGEIVHNNFIYPKIKKRSKKRSLTFPVIENTENKKQKIC